jgi:hypothetical protein
MLKFEHVFVDEPEFGQFSDELYDKPPDAKIEFSVDTDGIWLAANSEGFLYLARLFAELGTRRFESGYHFHRPEWLKKPEGAAGEVSVEVLSEDSTTDV